MKLKKTKIEDLKLGQQVYLVGYVTPKYKQPKLVKREYTITQEDLDNPKLTFYIEPNRPKTISKNYYDDEIQGILEDGSIYLKLGVKRKSYGDHLEYDAITQIMQEDSIYKAAQIYKKLKKEDSDFN